ncbi:hypothetical protein SCLCIDRAFT_21161 [Scleroderma citrinum Foug A]|uniref:Uncharacterized protein n=1 Tax=Scleroderma citrinum Foug A TaxID=1036808 RepID=A0A0C3EG53_9AGAM|nr:hypothetical protein SCLCIDRAFT_21161 [Scleroderma citrinum Foug A]
MQQFGHASFHNCLMATLTYLKPVQESLAGTLPLIDNQLWMVSQRGPGYISSRCIKSCLEADPAQVHKAMVRDRTFVVCRSRDPSGGLMGTGSLLPLAIWCRTRRLAPEITAESQTSVWTASGPSNQEETAETSASLHIVAIAIVDTKELRPVLGLPALAMSLADVKYSNDFLWAELRYEVDHRNLSSLNLDTVQLVLEPRADMDGVLCCYYFVNPASRSSRTSRASLQ